MNKTREAARVAGEHRYNTGEPCKRGHLSDRYTASANCVECQNMLRRKEFQHHDITPDGMKEPA